MENVGVNYHNKVVQIKKKGRNRVIPLKSLLIFLLRCIIPALCEAIISHYKPKLQHQNIISKKVRGQKLDVVFFFLKPQVECA